MLHKTFLEGGRVVWGYEWVQKYVYGIRTGELFKKYVIYRLWDVGSTRRVYVYSGQTIPITLILIDKLL